MDKSKIATLALAGLMVLGMSACSPADPEPTDTSTPEVTGPVDTDTPEATEPEDTSAPVQTEPQETQAEQEEQEPQESVEPTADTEPTEIPAPETPAQEEVTEPPAQQASTSEAQTTQSKPSTPDENISYGGADGGWGSPDTGSQTTQQPSGNGNGDALREWMESHGGEVSTSETGVDPNDPDYAGQCQKAERASAKHRAVYRLPDLFEI